MFAMHTPAVAQTAQAGDDGAAYTMSASPLPNWLAPGEKIKQVPSDLKRELTVKTPAGFRIPAEYEPVSVVVLGWKAYTGLLTGIVKAASAHGAQVWAVDGPSKISGVSNYKSISFPLDSVWMRDYGPFGIKNGSQLGIVDSIYRHYQYRPDDDALPKKLGNYAGAGVYSMNIILDGGNLMVDSLGNLYMTKRTYKWNSDKSESEVNQILKDSLKVKNIYTFEYAGYPGDPSDGTGHIDMFMKLLNDNTVLIAKSEDEPFKTTCEKAVKWFEGNTAPNGKPWKIVRSEGWYTSSGVWYTYTNSLIVNNTVIMPSFSGHSKEEAGAIAAYKAGMPGVTVVPVSSDDSIVDGGSVHCVTQTLPVAPSAKKDNKVVEVETPVIGKDVPESLKPLENQKF